MKIHIVTERLIIRDLEEFDAQGIFELDSDPKVHEYLGKKPIKTINEAQGTINVIRKHYLENGIGRWAIIDKNTKEFIGWAGLKFEQELRNGFSYYDLGYRLRSKYWGKGIATEAATECLKYGFDTLKLETICAAVNIDNLPSNQILKKIGLRFVETFEFDGIPCNWYVIKKVAWEKKQ
ncbi:MAG: GNAT family N-acetyltransferase [Maribacter sp.]|nr:GNAT family N-acetyltransferase [Maribacter sp.]